MVGSHGQSLYDARTFWELLDRRADATPDRTMLIDASDRRVTFGEFRSCGVRPRCMHRLEAAGIRIPPNLFAERTLMRA